MKIRIGMFIASTEDGSTVTDKVFKYSTYQEMLDDTDHGKYGIVDNVVYHNVKGTWVVGFSNVEYPGEYTAFEVAAHDYDIPAGDSEFLGGYVSKPIPASMTHVICLRSTVRFEDLYDIVKNDAGSITSAKSDAWKKSDVVIDWGDGSVTSVASCDPLTATGDPETAKDILTFDVNGADLELKAEYLHTYANPGKYIVKVYGNDYFCIGAAKDRSITNASEKDAWYTKYNLICRVMDVDLPISSHVTSLARFAQRSIRLLKIQVPSYYKFPAIENGSGMFGFCFNLQYIKGFKNRLAMVAVMEDCCNGCGELLESDLMIPCILSRGSAKAFYANCPKLTTGIETLFHGCGILNSKLSLRTTFKGCKSTKTDYSKLAKLLWNNPNVEFTDTTQALWVDTKNGSNPEWAEEQGSLIPKSWGGTLAE